MKTLPLSNLITQDQFLALRELYTEGGEAKHLLAFINTQPDILRNCEQHEVLPAYLAYYLMYIFGGVSCRR